LQHKESVSLDINIGFSSQIEQASVVLQPKDDKDGNYPHESPLSFVSASEDMTSPIRFDHQDLQDPLRTIKLGT
jgi:hypothetical protein